MYISRNDGYFNTDVSMQRDTLINANTLARVGRETYSPEEASNLKALLKQRKELFFTA